MRRRPRVVLETSTLAFLGLLIACGSSTDPVEPPEKPPVQVLRIEPATATIPSGTRATLMAVLFRDGKRIGSVSANWESPNENVAEVTAPGRLRALHTGQINVTATLDTMVAKANVVVTPGAPRRVDLAPKGASVLIGKSLQFTTTSFDSIGNQAGRVASGVSYTSSDPTRLSISSTGLAEAKGLGTTRLRATYLSMRDSTDATVMPRQIELTIAGTGRDEWQAYSYIIYEPTTHVVERSVVVTFVDASDGNKKVYGGAVTINGSSMTWDGTEYTASVLGLTAPQFTIAATGSSPDYVEPFTVTTPLAPMLEINIAERATYHVPGGDTVTWTPFDPTAQVYFKLSAWNYAPPGYTEYGYCNEWIPDSGSKGMPLWEVPVHFMILKLERSVENTTCG